MDKKKQETSRRSERTENQDHNQEQNQEKKQERNQEQNQENNQPKRWVACPLEDEYFGSSCKDSREERKRLSKKDRSKYKKTDEKKYTKGLKNEFKDRRNDEKLLRGRVLSVTSRGYEVDFDGIIYTCALRGLLKKDRTQAKNLVTVGDFVLFEIMPDNEGVIHDVEPRHSVLSRADNLSRRKEQLIAANIDQVLITSSVMTPPLKPSLIDRYIIAAKKGGMDPVIIINKCDLLSDHTKADHTKADQTKDDKDEAENKKKNQGISERFNDDVLENQTELLQECRKTYQSLGIPLIILSTKTGEGIDHLRDIMKNKSSVFSGQSGTGKSSLINIITGRNFITGDTVRHSGKGAHTTTTAQLVPLDFGGWCIDTPGIKSFGVWDLDAAEVEGYYTEIHEVGRSCKFPNCSHSHETDCAVIKAVEKGEISPLRYDSYQALLETIQQKHLRR